MKLRNSDVSSSVDDLSFFTGTAVCFFRVAGLCFFVRLYGTWKDIMHIFQHFDRDNSKTLSVEEFSDLLLKEAGPHNYSYKEYNKAKTQVQSEDGKTKLAPSSRPHSEASNWTKRVRGKAGKQYSKTSDVTTKFSISESSRTSKSTN